MTRNEYSIFRLIIALGILILISQHVDAQDIQYKNETESSNRHSINVELLGRTFLFSSVNYEYAINTKFSLGTGLGLVSLQRGDITRNMNGVPETGRYLDLASTQMIYGNYFVGSDKHKLVLTAGLTNFLISSRNTYPSDTELSSEINIEWNAGLGYQYNLEQLYFRLSGYVISLPEPSAWFPKYMPWVGLSIGYKL